MRWVLALFLSLVFLSSTAQKIGDGLWNAGRVFSVSPAEHTDSLILQNFLAKIQLYPGFAVVRTDLELLNRGNKSLTSALIWTDSLTTIHDYFQKIGNLTSTARLLVVNKDTIPLHQSIQFSPGITRITVFEITPNQQALLSRDGSVKEGNAFVYTMPSSSWKNAIKPQVIIQLAGDMTLTNMMGIYPDSAVTATMTQIKWNPLPPIKSIGEQSLVIWYQGAPADMKLEKKVLPAKDQLYRELNKVNLSLFDNPSFVVTDKKDFSTNKRSPLFSFLYFLMFLAPWILLVGFLVWLVFKPKKKKES